MICPKSQGTSQEADSKEALGKHFTDALPLTCPSLLQCSPRQGYIHQRIIFPHYSHCEVVGLEPAREYINTPGIHNEEGASMLGFTESMQQEHLIRKLFWHYLAFKCGLVFFLICVLLLPSLNSVSEELQITSNHGAFKIKK